MDDKHLGIIPCTKDKIWDHLPDLGATKAAYAYSGPVFTLAKEYVSKIADRVIIFSAKYGFLDLFDTIPGSYDVTFSRSEDPYVNLSFLREQAVQKELLKYNRITAVCNVHYQQRISTVFSHPHITIDFPSEGMIDEKEIYLKLTEIISGNGA